MVTEADILLLKSRINELEEKLQFLYQSLIWTMQLQRQILPSHLKFRMPVRRGNKIEAINYIVS